MIDGFSYLIRAMIRKFAFQYNDVAKFGRFIGAGVNFALAASVKTMGTLGTPVALTAIAFGIGILVIPFARETRGETLPE